MNPDDLAQRKKDLYVICDRIAKARAHDEELEEYMQIIKIRKSAQERGSRRRPRNTIGFDSAERIGISTGEDIHHNTHHKVERKMTTTHLKYTEKRGALKFPPTGIDALLMGGGTGDTGTPRRP